MSKSNICQSMITMGSRSYPLEFCESWILSAISTPSVSKQVNILLHILSDATSVNKIKSYNQKRLKGLSHFISCNLTQLLGCKGHACSLSNITMFGNRNIYLFLEIIEYSMPPHLTIIQMFVLSMHICTSHYLEYIEP